MLCPELIFKLTYMGMKGFESNFGKLMAIAGMALSVMGCKGKSPDEIQAAARDAVLKSYSSAVVKAGEYAQRVKEQCLYVYGQEEKSSCEVDGQIILKGREEMAKIEAAKQLEAIGAAADAATTKSAETVSGGTDTRDVVNSPDLSGEETE